MNLKEFDFALPSRLIAQSPSPERDRSRMMVVRRRSGKVEHCCFRDLPDILGPEHFLVLNNSRVLSARLRAHRPGKSEEIEVLLVRELSPTDWLALIRPAKKTPPGQKIEISELSAHVMETRESGTRVLRFAADSDIHQAIEKLGEPPLPPYIRRAKGQSLDEDKVRYQTIYARNNGSVAAPTAGLHFTEDVFSRLRAGNIPICEIMLHVGYGTFQPVRTERIEEHRMEPEYYEIDDSTARLIRSCKSEGRRLIAVGTTTTRCLEFLARQEGSLNRASAGLCNLFIYPGFDFQILDGLLTNFHLPQSTLFMLVCAFAGRELMIDCYREAIAGNYRFYSYGDCMLII